MGNLDFGLLDTNLNTETPYTSDIAGGGTAENVSYVQAQVANTWIEIYVVPTGKTFYLTDITINSDRTGVTSEVGVGAAASEVSFLKTWAVAPNEFKQINLATPIKFSSGARIVVRHSGTTGSQDTSFTIVGREE